MSKSVRTKTDRMGQLEIFPTSSWPVDRLLDLFQPTGGRWFEPCAGEGHIVRAVDAWFSRNKPGVTPTWEYTDIRPTRYAQPACDMTLDTHPFVGKSFDTIITNPPFSRALELLRVLWPMAQRSVAFLLPLSFLGSNERMDYLRENTPSLFILPERPVFDGYNTDQETYAWLVFSRLRTVKPGFVHILPSTPAPVRRASEAEAFKAMPPEWHREVAARKEARKARARAQRELRASLEKSA